jgi:hypothetical protein
MLSFAFIALVVMNTTSISPALASEQGFLPPESLTLDGTDATKTKLTMFGGQSVECLGTYKGHKYNVTPHELLEANATTATVTPSYAECTAKIGEPTVPATVTTNGCDYVLQIGATTEAGKWAATTDIVCPEGAQVETHAYSSSSHATSICTYKLPAQTGLSGAYVKNIGGGKITLGGTVKGIKVTRTGILCGGTAETKEAEEHLDVEFSGTDGEGGVAEVSVSD